MHACMCAGAYVNMCTYTFHHVTQAHTSNEKGAYPSLTAVAGRPQ